MTEYDPVRFCLALLLSSDEPGAARKKGRERGTALFGRSGVASALVAAGLQVDDSGRAPALVLENSNGFRTKAELELL